MGENVSDIADHPSRAWRVATTVLTEGNPNGSIKLKRGEELFVIAYGRPLIRARPDAIGPEEILVDGTMITGGEWPVILCPVRPAHIKVWAEYTDDTPLNRQLGTRMIERARRQMLATKEPAHD